MIFVSDIPILARAQEMRRKLFEAKLRALETKGNDVLDAGAA